MFYFIIKMIYSKLCVILYFFTSRVSRLRKSRNIASISDIKVLHQSEHFILISKRYDVLVNSNKPEDKVTVQTQLRNLVPELVNPKLKHEFNFVHRLDFATSGILCLPVHKQACKYASQAFEKQTIEKYYLAIVRGLLSLETFEIRKGIGEDTRGEYQGLRMAVEGSPHVAKTRSASTRVLVLERGICYDFPATKVLLKPLTGRRHQLRLHMNTLGHTIVGDFTYSNRHDTHPYRMFLHAFRLVLPSPLEHVDVQTRDPFLEENPRNRWKPIEVVNKLDINAMVKLKEFQQKITII